MARKSKIWRQLNCTLVCHGNKPRLRTTDLLILCWNFEELNVLLFLNKKLIIFRLFFKQKKSTTSVAYFLAEIIFQQHLEKKKKDFRFFGKFHPFFPRKVASSFFYEYDSLSKSLVHPLKATHLLSYDGTIKIVRTFHNCSKDFSN